MKLRSHLILLVVSALVPVLIFAGIVITRLSREQGERIRTDLIAETRERADDIDRELTASIRTLEALATSDHLDSGDIRRFYQQAKRVLKAHRGWETILLADPSGQQLVNLRLPFGSPLPRSGALETIKQVVETKRPIISNLFLGRIVGRYLVGVDIPVIRDEKVKYVLTISTSPMFLTELISRKRSSTDFEVVVIDRNKKIIARTRNIEQFLGKPAPLFQVRSDGDGQAVWQGVLPEGPAVEVAAFRSTLSGWTVGVAIPLSAYNAPVRRSLTIVVVGGLALLLVGTVLATVFGRRIANSITALSDSAAALGRGETPKTVASPIIEVSEVGRALEEAAITRGRSEESLRESQAQMAEIIESAMDGIISVDSDQRIILFNSAAEEMFQWSAKEIVGKPLDCLIPEGFRAAHQEHIRLFGRAGVTNRRIGSLGAVTGLRANGELFPIEASISQTETGRRKVFTVILRDITERERAEEETQRNLGRIRALHEIDRAITSTLDLRAVLDILLDKIDLALYAAATVRLFNRKSGLLEPVACRNLDENEWKSEAWKGGRGTSNIVFESGAPLMIANVQADARMRDPEFFQKHGLVSYLGVPLVAKGDVLGSLGFYTKEEHQFDSSEVEFLQTLAAQAAIAINNARLYDKVDQSRRELELTNQYLGRSLKQLSGLYMALTPLSPAESVHEMMDGIIGRLIEATGADAALIRLQNRELGSFYWAAQRGFPDYYLTAVESPPPGSALEYVFRTGIPIIAPDITAEPRLKGKVQLQVGLRSCAMLPLKVHDEVRGIIHLASRDLGYFDEEQRDHLMAIARQMGIALENKELFDNLRASRDELEKANKVKDEFLSVMSHELRTPLNVVVGYAGMMKDGLLGEMNSRQREALEKIIYRTNDQLSMVNNILHATVLETEKINVDSHEVALPDFLNQLRLAYEAPINKEVILNWTYPSDLPAIKTDSGKLKQILQNLIDNALKFTNKGNVTISARLLEPSAPSDQQSAIRNSKSAISQVEFTVLDTGVGIPPDALPFIFDKFHQVDSSETRLFGGVGMGLYIVKQFTELLGGTIQVESEAGKGSTFTVIIPCVHSF